MRHPNSAAWFAVRHWSVRPFLLAGGLLGGSVLLKALELFTGTTLPGLAVALVAVPGHLAALVGLLGLYPVIADRSRRLGRMLGAAVVVAGGWLIGLLGWAVAGPALNATLGPVVPAEPPDVAFVSGAVALGVAFALFGAAVVRAEPFTHRTGVFLAIFAGTWLVLFAFSFRAAVPDWQWFAVYAVQPPVLLATGWTLQTVTSSTNAVADQGDTSTG